MGKQDLSCRSCPADLPPWGTCSCMSKLHPLPAASGEQGQSVFYDRESGCRTGAGPQPLPKPASPTSAQLCLLEDFSKVRNDHFLYPVLLTKWAQVTTVIYYASLKNIGPSFSSLPLASYISMLSSIN